MRDTLTSLRYRYWPDHLLGEILSKRWTETAIPVILLLIVGFALSRSIDHFLSPSSLADTARQAGEIGFIGSFNFDLRSAYLKQLHAWHWISAAISLAVATTARTLPALWVATSSRVPSNLLMRWRPSGR